MIHDDFVDCDLCGDEIYSYYYDHPLGCACEECFEAYVRRELRHKVDYVVERF